MVQDFSHYAADERASRFKRLQLLSISKVVRSAKQMLRNFRYISKYIKVDKYIVKMIIAQIL